MKLCICSLSDREWLYDLTKPNLQSYCDKFNIDFKFINHSLDNERATSWSKLLLVKDLLLSDIYDYVIWIDDDILLTDFNKDIRDFIDNDKPIIIQNDPDRKGNDTLYYDDINCGFIFFKNGSETIDIINHIYDMGGKCKYKTERNWEQNVFIDYYNNCDKKSFDIKPYRTFQSFHRGDNSKHQWTMGDFSSHFSGIDKCRRIVLINVLSNKLK